MRKLNLFVADTFHPGNNNCHVSPVADHWPPTPARLAGPAKPGWRFSNIQISFLVNSAFSRGDSPCGCLACLSMWFKVVEQKQKKWCFFHILPFLNKFTDFKACSHWFWMLFSCSLWKQDCDRFEWHLMCCLSKTRPECIMWQSDLLPLWKHFLKVRGPDKLHVHCSQNDWNWLAQVKQHIKLQRQPKVLIHVWFVNQLFCHFHALSVTLESTSIQLMTNRLLSDESGLVSKSKFAIRSTQTKLVEQIHKWFVNVFVCDASRSFPRSEIHFPPLHPALGRNHPTWKFQACSKQAK